MNLKAQLKKCSKADLIQLIERVYGASEDIDAVIHAFLLTGNAAGSDGVVASLSQDLGAIINGVDFIDYRHSGDFAARLERVLFTACDRVSPQNPAAALSLVEYFMSLVDQLFERVDDSGGDIGMLFMQVVELWLELAEKVRKHEPEGATDWVERVLYYFDHNDYGVFDELIPKSATLLTEQELRQLAWRFENDARKALQAQPETDQPGKYNQKAAHACIGLASVARALSDMTLYEKSTLIRRPAPNYLQLAAIIRFALSIKEYDRARYWLAQDVWREHPDEHTRLNNELLRLQGDTEGLKANLFYAFMEQAYTHCLKEYWELANDAEKAEQRPTIVALAQQSDDLVMAVESLLTIDEISAAAKCISRTEKPLDQVFYAYLTNWAACFEQSHEGLAAILCYRALLSDILDSGRSKAYRHAARYFRRLLQLDKQQADYGEHGDAQQYIGQLQQKHWRKRAFWSQADYPNKAQ
jgi:hypothetical protein